MKHVLIIANQLPVEPSVLADYRQRFADAGAEVQVGIYQDPTGLGLDAHWFGDPANAPRPKPWASARSTPGRAAWLFARRDPWIAEHARAADILVALDPNAVYTVWELAQRHPRAEACNGLAAGLKALPEPPSGGAGASWLPARIGIGLRGVRRISARGADAVYRRAVGTRVLRTSVGAKVWGAVATASWLTEPIRADVALRVHQGLVRAGKAPLAKTTTRAAVGALEDATTRAEVLTAAAQAEFRLGQVPGVLDLAIAANVEVADEWLRRDPGRAPSAFWRAMAMATNRILHVDRLASPLIDDPGRFLAAFRKSTLANRLRAPRGRTAPMAPRPTDRPLRLLIATCGNDRPVDEIGGRYENRPDVEVRFLDLAADPSRQEMLNRAGPTIKHLLDPTSPVGSRVEDWLGPHVDWADTVLVDGCDVTASMFTLLDPGTTRIVVRVHGPETFTVWPHLIDFTRVDELVFVSEHWRDLTTTVFPQLLEPDAPQSRVIAPALDLQRFVGPKPAAARFIIGLIGIGAVTEDPRWAIDVLGHLRRHDERYQLRLIGPEIDPTASVAARQYVNKYRAALAKFPAVVQAGAELAEVGVILNSSVREAFPIGLVEGAASAAVPMVRDWPAFAGKPHGARTLFPADWVVDTTEEAAKRILAATVDEETWREEGRLASAHAISEWDWTQRVRAEFDRLLLP